METPRCRRVGDDHGMARLSFPSLLVVISLALLVHATLCAIQRAPAPIAPVAALPLLTADSAAMADRDYLKAVQQPFVFSPFAVRCAARPSRGVDVSLGA